MSREFDYTIVETETTRIVIDWEVNRAYDATFWTQFDRDQFIIGNAVTRRVLVQELPIVKMDSWALPKWDVF